MQVSSRKATFYIEIRILVTKKKFDFFSFLYFTVPLVFGGAPIGATPDGERTY